MRVTQTQARDRMYTQPIIENKEESKLTILRKTFRNPQISILR